MFACSLNICRISEWRWKLFAYTSALCVLCAFLRLFHMRFCIYFVFAYRCGRGFTSPSILVAVRTLHFRETMPQFSLVPRVCARSFQFLFCYSPKVFSSFVKGQKLPHQRLLHLWTQSGSVSRSWYNLSIFTFVQSVKVRIRVPNYLRNFSSILKSSVGVHVVHYLPRYICSCRLFSSPVRAVILKSEKSIGKHDYAVGWRRFASLF